jgi:2-iminobutanoate/2-iminopropanoate deaminase
MKIEPIHHVPMKPEYRSPYSAAYAVEDARLVFFSGCCTIPIYHKHPHDPTEEARWLAGDIREQTERTFEHIRQVLEAAGGAFSSVLQVTIYCTNVDHQNIINEISAKYFGAQNPPARTFLQVVALAHPGMLVEIDGVAAVPKSGAGGNAA